MPECNHEYWEKINQGQLCLQYCSNCDKYIFYPRSLCPDCLESSLEWKPASGKGKVYSYTIVHVNELPDFAAETPYIYAIIELDEGVRMPGSLYNCSFEQVKVDMPVELTFIERKGKKIPAFKPA